MNTQKYSAPFALLSEPRRRISVFTDTAKRTEGFTSLIKYLVRLRRDGTLDDHDFSELVRTASAAFIESELNKKIEHVLERHIPTHLFSGLGDD